MIVVILFTMNSIPAKAEELSYNINDVGIPNELLKIMPEDQKDDIIKNNLKFMSYEKVTLDEQHAGKISPYGTIPSSDLNFYISIYYTDSTYNKNIRQIRLYANYDWNVMPIFTLTDPFGVAWDSNIWRAVDNTAKSSYFYKLGNGTTKNDTDSVLTYSDFGGAGWAVNIRQGYGAWDVNDNYGWGAITLKALNPSATTTTQFHANYTHVYGAGSIGLQFSGISVSYTGSAVSDSRGTYQTLSY